MSYLWTLVQYYAAVAAVCVCVHRRAPFIAFYEKDSPPRGGKGSLVGYPFLNREPETRKLEKVIAPSCIYYEKQQVKIIYCNWIIYAVNCFSCFMNNW